MAGSRIATDSLAVGDFVARSTTGYSVDPLGQDIVLTWLVKMPENHGYGRQPYGASPYGGTHVINLIGFEILVYHFYDDNDTVGHIVRRDRVQGYRYVYQESDNAEDAARGAKPFQPRVKFTVTPVLTDGIGAGASVETTEGADVGSAVISFPKTFNRPVAVKHRHTDVPQLSVYGNALNDASGGNPYIRLLDSSDTVVWSIKGQTATATEVWADSDEPSLTITEYADGQTANVLEFKKSSGALYGYINGKGGFLMTMQNEQTFIIQDSGFTRTTEPYFKIQSSLGVQHLRTTAIGSTEWASGLGALTYTGGIAVVGWMTEFGAYAATAIYGTSQTYNLGRVVYLGQNLGSPATYAQMDLEFYNNYNAFLANTKICWIDNQYGYGHFEDIDLLGFGDPNSHYQSDGVTPPTGITVDSLNAFLEEIGYVVAEETRDWHHVHLRHFRNHAGTSVSVNSGTAGTWSEQFRFTGAIASATIMGAHSLQIPKWYAANGSTVFEVDIIYLARTAPVSNETYNFNLNYSEYDADGTGFGTTQTHAFSLTINTTVTIVVPYTKTVVVTTGSALTKEFLRMAITGVSGTATVNIDILGIRIRSGVKYT